MAMTNKDMVVFICLVQNQESNFRDNHGSTKYLYSNESKYEASSRVSRKLMTNWCNLLGRVLLC